MFYIYFAAKIVNEMRGIDFAGKCGLCPINKDFLLTPESVVHLNIS